MRVCSTMLFLIAFATAVVSQDKPQAAPPDDKPRVFITDSESWEMAGSGGGTNGTYGSHFSGGARPQTAEIVKTFGDRCPQVITNNKQEKAEYIVVLDHEGGKSVLRHKNKVAVFSRTSGDSIVSKSTLSLGGSVQDACEAITADWSKHANDIRADEAKEAEAAAPKPIAAAVQQQPVAQTTVVQLAVSSDPTGADIEIDGNFVGNTPSSVGVTPGKHQIAVKKAGFKTWERGMMFSTGQVTINAGLEPESK